MSSCCLDEWRLVVVELIVRQRRRQLADGTASHEARRLGGGYSGSPDRWWRPRRAGNTMEGGCREHNRVREGSVVGMAARDQAARWKRIRAREGTVENFIFFWQGADKREPRRDSKWERRVRPHGRPCEIIIVEKLE
jgi:hypothetical protein